MLPQDAALQVQEGAGGRGTACAAGDEAHIVPVRDEADVLTVPLPGGDEAVGLCQFPDLRLGEAAQGNKVRDSCSWVRRQRK